MIPQLLILLTGMIGLGVNITRHKELKSLSNKKPDEYNGWVKLISLFILYSLLYWGGFFDVMIKNL